MMSNLAYIREHILSDTTKVLYIGDPRQLPPVGMHYCPFVHLKVPEVSLTKIVRQAEGNPIIQMATGFREAVPTGLIPTDNPVSEQIEYIGDHKDFCKRLVSDFKQHQSNHTVGKILCFSNSMVQNYNKLLRKAIVGNDVLAEGDWALNNSAVTLDDRLIRQQRMVRIAKKTKGQFLSVEGWYIQLDDFAQEGFLPMHINDKKTTEAELQKKHTLEMANGVADRTTYTHLREVQNWLDLRDCYACTVHKSQGMTYHTTYIDLTDLSRYVNRKMLARLLYVATSRASDKVVFTGTI